MNNTEQLINNISKGQNLTFDESKEIFLNIMSGKMKENLIQIKNQKHAPQLSNYCTEVINTRVH